MSTNDQKPETHQVRIQVPSEWSPEFVQGMADRMSVSFFKYGAIQDAFPGKIDATENVRLRIEKYRETKNLEFLIDAANYCLIEFMCPSERDAFFKDTDSDESPGVVTRAGIMNHGPTKDLTAGGAKRAPSRLRDFR